MARDIPLPEETYEHFLSAGLGNPEQRARYRADLAELRARRTGAGQSQLFESHEADGGGDRHLPQPGIFDGREVISLTSSADQGGANGRADHLPRAEDDHAGGIVFYDRLAVSAAVKNNGGAWRVWQFCKHLDLTKQNGRGWVERDELCAYLDELEVHPRTGRRWIAEALRMKLIKAGRTAEGAAGYWPISAENAGLILGAKAIGQRVQVDAGRLAGKGWKRAVWAGHLATYKAPISQARKYQITGVQPRLQRLWQAPDAEGIALSFPVYNYATTDIDPAHVARMNEITGLNYFVARDQDGRQVVRQRLPDQRVVHTNVVKVLPVGERTRIVNETFETSSPIGTQHDEHRANGERVRQFNFVQKQVKRTRAKLNRMSIHKRPLDIFKHVSTRFRVNLWTALPTYDTFDQGATLAALL